MRDRSTTLAMRPGLSIKNETHIQTMFVYESFLLGMFKDSIGGKVFYERVFIRN